MNRGVWISVILFASIVLVLFVVSRLFLGDDDREGFGIGFAERDVVGLVQINGGIFDARATVESLGKLRRSPRVKSLLLRINSPGGGVGPTQEIYEEVQRFRRTGRKVVASLGSVAASGGYYIASAADRIYSNPGTITGSIGVIMVVPNAEKMVDALGLKFSIIKSAPHKDLASPLRKMSQADRMILQRLIDDTYGQFVRAVSEGRKIPMKEALRIADGSIYSGERAKELGLVDKLGSQWEATLEAARLANISGEPRVLEFRSGGGLFGFVRQSLEKVSNWVEGGAASYWGGYPAMLQYMWK